MKEHLRSLVARARDPIQGRNLAREYLQARILASLQAAGAMRPLAFLGGTALRFLHDCPRFSEDLDFAVVHEGSGYELRAYGEAVARDLAAEGYDLQVKIGDRRVVQSAVVRLPGLPHDLGLSPHRGRVLAIKIEVDT